jgi:short-subunit dehydrogenase
LRENLEVNVIGVLHVTQAFLPLLGAVRGYDGPKGRIINIGSVSGRFVLPLVGPYCASKYALVAISHAMRRELLIQDIDVSLVEPASAASEIWTKARDAETHVRGTAYERIEEMKTQLIDKQEKGAMPTQKVVDVIYKASVAGRPRPRYLVTPNNFINRIVHSLPDRWVDKLFKRAFDKANADSVQFWK